MIFQAQISKISFPKKYFAQKACLDFSKAGFIYASFSYLPLAAHDSFELSTFLSQHLSLDALNHTVSLNRHSPSGYPHHRICLQSVSQRLFASDSRSQLHRLTELHRLYPVLAFLEYRKFAVLTHNDPQSLTDSAPPPDSVFSTTPKRLKTSPSKPSTAWSISMIPYWSVSA